jgi:pyridinium-3,5-bisthiocarboxylic acid mononucleotide nickel chelatase
MKAIFFDCFSGISGDMALGALLDAGLGLERLRGEIAKLPLDGWRLDAERTTRGWLAGTRAHVDAPEQAQHRHLNDIRAILGAATGLAPEVAARSLAVFTRLAEAEGAVHGIDAEQVHFHEVGALDAVVDIVGVVAGLWLLGVGQVYASALPLGSGWARAAHGEIPVPAPATLELLARVRAPVLADATPVELVTPTGAALLAELARFERPALRIERVGYGFGRRELARPNALRVWLGELTTAEQAGDDAEQIVLLETNIDDQSGEQLAYALERLLELGALDAWAQPILMKKGRPATLLSALVPIALEEDACTLLFRETTTLGVRRRLVERATCERELATVETPLGPVRVKRKRWQGHELGAAPEYEDCAALARQHGLPLRVVYALAIEAASKMEARQPRP